MVLAVGRKEGRREGGRERGREGGRKEGRKEGKVGSGWVGSLASGSLSLRVYQANAGS